MYRPSRRRPARWRVVITRLDVANIVVCLGFAMALLYTLMFLLGGLADMVQPADLADYVLTTTGSEAGGNTFPGVSEPFGMVKLGPDLYTGHDSYSGYAPDGKVIGFSMLHLSGTGGAPKYGVVAQMPMIGAVDNPLADHGIERAGPDVSEVGYYRSHLKNNVTVELAAASRAGMYRYTFPNDLGASPHNILVDVSHVLPSFRGMGLGQRYLGGRMAVDNTSATGEVRYTGHGTYDNGWNRSPPWTVYFCGAFDAPTTSTSFQTFIATDGTGNMLARYPAGAEVESVVGRVGAVFTFDGPATATTLTSRMGVSFISEQKACRNLEEQVPRTTKLETLRNRTREAWNTRVLSRVTTTETNVTKLQHLYTSMYFMHLLPTNKTGENPKWESPEPYYDDTFTLWDLFRCTTPLLHILQPSIYEEFIRSLIDIYRHDGWMPDGRSSFFNGATQGGSNADTVLADAFVKGVRGKINWADGWAAMVKDAEIQPPNNDDPRDRSGSTKEGRGALPDWIRLGYISTRYARSVSRAVEYAGNDFGLFQVAKGMGDGMVAEADKYLQRSRQWRAHWNPAMKALNFSGFLSPRDEAGVLLDQDPMDCNGCYWANHYYQGLPWEYTFNAHHDLDTLISLAGGNDVFVARLETTFRPGARAKGGNARFNKTIFDPSNEPSFTTPYLFNFAGRQDLTVKTTRHIGKSYYSPTPGGIPGNSDAGAMESWILWAMIGLYPLTGQTTFLIGSPWFADLTISLDGVGGDSAGSKKRQLRITAVNGSEDSFYVQSLRVNGAAWTQSWATWDDLFAGDDGGTMEFVLGPEPANWTAGSAPPPSPASESYAGKTYTGGAGDGVGSSAGGQATSTSSSPTASWRVPVAASLSGVALAGTTAALGWLFWQRRRRRRRRMMAGGEEAMKGGGNIYGGRARPTRADVEAKQIIIDDVSPLASSKRSTSTATDSPTSVPVSPSPVRGEPVWPPSFD